MNSGVGMSAMSFSLHKGLLIQQLHSMVSPALDMTFPEMREKMGIWDLESGLPGCLRVNKVQSSKSMACLRPSSNLRSSSSTERCGQRSMQVVFEAYCCCLYVYYHFSLISYSLSQLEHRYVECKRKNIETSGRFGLALSSWM